ncbi:glutathione ABC transporter substrate-binding protein GsiB, partial [Ochrobactrum sp. MR31]|nr:glutathione ABC transporter substrate-binding protein GsiB [Ochrobactrum sp. MR31]
SLTVAVQDNLTGLDPAVVNDTLSQTSLRLIYQGLFGFDKDMKLIPLLAESYEANENATEFTIKLRKGIKFHDGTDFN